MVWDLGRTDGRTDVRTYVRTDSHVTTKIFEIDGLPNFLGYGAPPKTNNRIRIFYAKIFTIRVASLSILLMQSQVVSLNHFRSRIKHSCLRIYGELVCKNFPGFIAEASVKIFLEIVPSKLSLGKALGFSLFRTWPAILDISIQSDS